MTSNAGAGACYTNAEVGSFLEKTSRKHHFEGEGPKDNTCIMQAYLWRGAAVMGTVDSAKSQQPDGSPCQQKHSRRLRLQNLNSSL